MSKFEDLGSKFWKTNVRSEISIFEIGYRQNFVKIKNLILLDQSAQIWGFWLEIFKSKCQIWNWHLRNTVHMKFR